MASIEKRLERLEEKAGGRGGCKTCWGWDVDWETYRCFVGEGDPEPEIPRCPDCGRRPEKVFVRGVRVRYIPGVR